MCIGEEERQRDRETEGKREREREAQTQKLQQKKLLPFSACTLPVHLQLVLEVTDGNFHDLACLDNQLSSNCQWSNTIQE